MPLSTSYTVETLPKTMNLIEDMDSTQTSFKINYVPLAMTKGILIIDEGQDNEERVAFNSVVDNGDDTATLGDATRGLPFHGNTFTGDAELAYPHTGGASTVRLVVAHELLNLAGYTDRANSWNASQTLNGSYKWLFGGTDVWVRGDGGTEMYFRSSTTAEKSLAQLASNSGSDEKVKASITDTQNDYLGSKITVSDGIQKNTQNGGANENIQLKLSDPINFKDSTELTIASDAVARTQTLHTIDTEGDAASDNLSTISGGDHGDMIILSPENAARVVTVKDSVGNIIMLGGDYVMNSAKCSITLRYNGTNWVEMSRALLTTGFITSVPQTYVVPLLTPGVASAQFGASTSAEIDVASTHRTTIGANTLAVGDDIYLDVSVTYHRNSTADTATVRVYLAGVTIQTFTFNNAGGTDSTFRVRCKLTVTAIGAGGAVSSLIEVMSKDGTAAQANTFPMVPSTASVDTTGALACKVTAASNTASANQYCIVNHIDIIKHVHL